MPQPEKRPKKRTNPYFHGIAALAAAALLLLVYLAQRKRINEVSDR